MDVITFPVNLYTTSGLLILLHGVISLPDETSYDNEHLTSKLHMNRATRKSIFRVFEQFMVKPACSATETCRMLKFSINELRYNALQGVNNKGENQTAQMQRPVCAIDVHIQ